MRSFFFIIGRKPPINIYKKIGEKKVSNKYISYIYIYDIMMYIDPDLNLRYYIAEIMTGHKVETI